MATIIEKSREALEFYGKNTSLRRASAQQFMVAICHTQLGCYESAEQFYTLALVSSFRDHFWFVTSQPNWLVDMAMMSDQIDSYPKIVKELEAYRSDPRGTSLWALYAYATMDLALGKNEDIERYISGLLAKPKIKDMYASGQVLQAIAGCEQVRLDSSLEGLLLAHHRKATYGGLRETPEGYLCLPAMSLSKIALERGLQISIESPYLSKGYLAYLSQLHQVSI